MNKVEVKFGEWIQKGFDLYKANLGPLIVAALLTVVLSVVTIGILAGPLYAGLVLMTLGFLDKQEPKPQIGDVFKGFEVFLQSFLFFLVWCVISLVISFGLSLIPCLGPILSMLVSWAISTCLMFGLFLIADKRLDFWPASMDSFNAVKTNFWPFLGLYLVASIIGSIGAIACGIGVIVTLPITVCILAVAYREIFTMPAAAAPAPAP